MPGRITLVGAGELMSSMSPQHRIALSRLAGPPQPIFLDTPAGFETNVEGIAEKAVEYYDHHLQVPLRVARYRHRDLASAADVAAAIAGIRDSNMIFAGPGSPTYAIHHWQASPVWEAVVQRFEAGADIFFASAASITLGSYALPVYEIYKAGQDPFWNEGLDLLGHFGLKLAIIPHYNDNSGGENYDSRFCYMGARRFDLLQEQLPQDVAILGIDAYTSICFDPGKGEASVSGQGGVTLIAQGAEQRLLPGNLLPFEAFQSSDRGVVRTFDPVEGQRLSGYEFTDASDSTDPLASLTELVEQCLSLTEGDRVELLARIQSARARITAPDSSSEGLLVDLILELREALRQQKQFQMADEARKRLDDLGFEIGDTAQGAKWTRR